MNLTIQNNTVKVWGGVEPTQTISGQPLPVRCGFFTPMIFNYGRVACNDKIPLWEKLQTRLIARVQVPDHPFIEPKGNRNQSGVKNMSNLLSIQFDNSTIVHFTTNGYLNATNIALKFGKKPSNYLRNEVTQDYINAIAHIRAIDKDQLVIIKRGSSENGGGTWLHPKLAIDFARWLSPEFAVWCDEQIEKILNKNYQPKVEPTTPQNNHSKSKVANAPENLNSSRAFALALMRNGSKVHDEVSRSYCQLIKNLEIATENLHKVINQVNHVKKMIHHIDVNDGAIHDGLTEARIYLFLDKQIYKDSIPIAERLYEPLDLNNI